MWADRKKIDGANIWIHIFHGRSGKPVKSDSMIPCGKASGRSIISLYCCCSTLRSSTTAVAVADFIRDSWCTGQDSNM